MSTEEDRIKADPLATAADILWLKDRGDPVAAITHPNCPPDIWWELAAKYPIEAQASVLYPMLTLESPERWAKLEKNNRLDWLTEAIERLPQDKQHLIAAECAERVLSLFEREYPGDKRPREAIQALRLFANREITETQVTTAREAAQVAGLAATKGVAQIAAMATSAETTRHMLYYATLASAKDVAERGARVLIFAAEEAVKKARGLLSDVWLAEAVWQTIRRNAQDAEQKWQWERVQSYLRGEVD